MLIKTRRDFLTSLGLGAGASFLAPFFNSLAWAETKGSMPRRYVFVVEGNCVEPINFLSQKAKAELESTLGNLTIDEHSNGRWFYHLYKHAGGPLVIEDTNFETASALGSVIGKDGQPSLAQDTSVVLGLSSTVTSAGHSTNHGALSCSLSAPGKPGGQTIDAYLAALPSVRKNAPFDAVRLGTSGSTGRRLNYDTCAFGAFKPAPIILHPAVAYNSLFGSVASVAGKAAFNERKDLLSFAKEDVTLSLKAFSGNSRERAKLEMYLESLESLSKTQQILLTMEKQLLDNKPVDPSQNPLYGKEAPYLDSGADSLNRLRAQFELATAALKGELTNVVVIASGTGKVHFDVSYQGLAGEGGTIKRHDLHHISSGNKSAITAIHDASRQHADMVCQLARDLAATPEPNADGSMLDHTVIVYTSDNGEQHHSKGLDWPMLVIGGKKIGMKQGGRTVIYPTMGYEGHRQVSNFFNTLGHTAGQNLNWFGHEGAKRIKPGPLPHIYSG